MAQQPNAPIPQAQLTPLERDAHTFETHYKTQISATLQATRDNIASFALKIEADLGEVNLNQSDQVIHSSLAKAIENTETYAQDLTTLNTSENVSITQAIQKTRHNYEQSLQLYNTKSDAKQPADALKEAQKAEKEAVEKLKTSDEDGMLHRLHTAQSEDDNSNEAQRSAAKAQLLKELEKKHALQNAELKKQQGVLESTMGSLLAFDATQAHLNQQTKSSIPVLGKQFAAKNAAQQNETNQELQQRGLYQDGAKFKEGGVKFSIGPGQLMCTRSLLSLDNPKASGKAYADALLREGSGFKVKTDENGHKSLRIDIKTLDGKPSSLEKWRPMILEAQKELATKGIRLDVGGLNPPQTAAERESLLKSIKEYENQNEKHANKQTHIGEDKGESPLTKKETEVAENLSNTEATSPDPTAVHLQETSIPNKGPAPPVLENVTLSNPQVEDKASALPPSNNTALLNKAFEGMSKLTSPFYDAMKALKSTLTPNSIQNDTQLKEKKDDEISQSPTPPTSLTPGSP